LFVSKEKAAEILGLHPKTVERLIGRGELKAYKPAGRVRIDCGDLRTFVESVRVEPSLHEI
jgi:excisionase family DNA binding protein